MEPVSVTDLGPEVVWAKNQPEYIPLPSVVSPDGRVITRWRLTWRERFQLLLHGEFYHQQLTFGHPLQPIKMTIEAPELP